jgi:hypothetical protein
VGVATSTRCALASRELIVTRSARKAGAETVLGFRCPSAVRSKLAGTRTLTAPPPPLPPPALEDPATEDPAPPEAPAELPPELAFSGVLDTFVLGASVLTVELGNDVEPVPDDPPHPPTTRKSARRPGNNSFLLTFSRIKADKSA